MFRSRKKAYSIFPDDIVGKMEVYGRFEFSPQDARPSATDTVAELLPQLYPIAQTNPDSFIQELAATVLPVGGWAVYGGQRCVRDLIDTKSRHPDHLAMVDAAVIFLRRPGYGSMHLSAVELEAWRELHPDDR